MSIRKAALINMIGKYSTILIQLAVNIILSRILSADEYGVVAVITTFSTFFYTLSAMGIGTAIIQKKDLNDEDINSIYTFSTYASIILAVSFCFLSYGIAWFYNDKIYIKLGMLLSFNLLFNGMNMVPQGIMSRDKRFVAIAIRTSVVYSIAAIIAIAMAVNGFSYYSLIVQNIFSAFSAFIWNYVTTRPRFMFRIQWESIRKIASYSGYQMGAQIIGYFSNNMDNLLSGRLLGTASLGYYNKAYTLTNYPINNFSGIIASALHPVLSDYQDDKVKLYTNHIKINRLFALMGGLVSTVFFLMAPEIIRILFGDNWENSVICLKILGLSIVFRMMNSSLGAFFQTLGRTDLLFKDRVSETIIIIVAILSGIIGIGGLTGLAIGVSTAYMIFYIIAIILLCIKGFEIKLIQHVRDMSREIIINIILYGVVIVYPIHKDTVFISILFKGLYVCLFFVLLVLAIDRQFIFSIILKKKRR